MSIAPLPSEPDDKPPQGVPTPPKRVPQQAPRPIHEKSQDKVLYGCHNFSCRVGTFLGPTKYCPGCNHYGVFLRDRIVKNTDLDEENYVNASDV